MTQNRRTSDEQTDLARLAAAAGALPLGLLAANLGSAAPRAAVQTTRAAAAAPTLLASPSADAVADAANAFLATLSEKQRAVAQIELTHRLAARWSNLPGGSNLRNGVFFRELKRRRPPAALKVARVWPWARRASRRYQGVRAADDAFAKGRGGRGPGAEDPAAGVAVGQADRGGPGGPPPGGGMFEQSDENKDGKLSRDEAPGFLRDRFAEIDTNKDGFISREEDTAFLQRGGPGGPGGPQGKAGGRVDRRARWADRAASGPASVRRTT